MEISPLICFANQWTGFYMIGTSVMKELIGFYMIRTLIFEQLSILVLCFTSIPPVNVRNPKVF